MSESSGAFHYEPIAVSDESTVVAEFVPEPLKESTYQSEAALEAAFIGLLQSQAYDYLTITDTSQLEDNLRTQLSALNKIEFSDAEWQRFVRQYRREMAAPDASHALALLAALSQQTDLAVGCYCENETRCHRSVLRSLLAEHGARLAESST